MIILAMCMVLIAMMLIAIFVKRPTGYLALMMVCILGLSVWLDFDQGLMYDFFINETKGEMK